VTRIYTVTEIRKARQRGNILFITGSAIALTGIALGGLSIQPVLSLTLVVTGFIIVLVSFKFDIRGTVKVALLRFSGRSFEVYIENLSRRVMMRVLKAYLRDPVGNTVQEKELNLCLMPGQKELIHIETPSSEDTLNIESVCVMLEGGFTVCVSESERIKEVQTF